MAQERKQMDRRWVWFGALVLLILVFFVTRSLSRDHLPVRAVQATHLSLASTVSTNGRVEPEVNYEIHSPVATTVKAVYVQPGDTVPAGKLLMVLDDTQVRARLAAAQSGVKAAQAAMDTVTHNGSQQERQMLAADIARERLERDQARHDLDALVKLNSTGAASQSEVAGARQRLDTAEGALRASEQSATGRYSTAEVERAQAALAEAQANLAAERQVLSQTSIHAPIAGTVYSLGATQSEFVEEGRLLLQMADLHHERVRAYFDEPEIGRLAVGQPIQVTWNAKQGRTWHGHIERVPSTVITYGTRTVGEVLVKIDDLQGDLLPDTNVTVTVTTSSQSNALSVARDALHSENGKPYVFKIINGGLHKTPVTTGTITLTEVEILSGLQDGDTVATGTTNGQPLQEGIPVKVVQ